MAKAWRRLGEVAESTSPSHSALNGLKACSSLGELLVRRTLFGQFDELYFVSELNVGRTFRSPNVVRTVRRTILRFSTDLLMRCKLQPELRCADCTQTRMHILTHDTCSLSSIRGRKPRQWTPRPSVGRWSGFTSVFTEVVPTIHGRATRSLIY